MPTDPIEREALFQRGLEAYRSGLHYEAHELWEALWEDEEDDAHRQFLQALIQVASAVHKVTHRVEPRGALRLLERALGRLEPLPATYGGVAVAPLRDAIGRYRTAVEGALASGQLASTAPLVPAIERAGDHLAWSRRPRTPAPDAARTFARALADYARGAFYEAHEHWEILWREEPEGPHRRFLQGLILVAASMHKLYAMKSPAGALRLLDRALDRLGAAPDGTDGIAVDRLREDAARTRRELERLAKSSDVESPSGLAPRIERVREP